jgi:hypothetical protein
MKLRPRYASNSGVFEKRGDPWVSEREGKEQFGRNLFSEDPDFDRYFSEKAEHRRANREIRTALAEESPIGKTVATTSRRASTLVLEAKTRMRNRNKG